VRALLEEATRAILIVHRRIDRLGSRDGCGVAAVPAPNEREALPGGFRQFTPVRKRGQRRNPVVAKRTFAS
jgi:hypothetical protein